MNDTGALVAALAKAQAQFGAVTRSKTVKVKTKSGQEYTFAYAPLDTILDAVRKPLADNGLAVMQMIDDGALVTSLMHESGAVVSGRVDIPQTPDIQEFGSAITYLRRYAIQAMLGIAAEEDDDGNRAAGNIAAPHRRESGEPRDDGSLVGRVEVGDKASSDFALRQTPDGYRLGFRLRGSHGGILVETTGALAEQLAAEREHVVGQTVSVWGVLGEREFTPRGKTEPARFQVLAAERLRAPGIGDLPVDTAPDENEPPEPPTEAEGGLTDAATEALFAELEAVGA